MMADQEKIKAIRRSLQKKAIPFHNVFSSPEGQQVLEALKAEFDPNTLCHTDAFTTNRLAAQRDVVVYIENMIKLREEDYG